MVGSIAVHLFKRLNLKILIRCVPSELRMGVAILANGGVPRRKLYFSDFASFL